MNTILKITNSSIINLFRKMTNEQIGKIIRAYLNNSSKDLIEDELKIYTELVKHRDLQKANNREKILKGWATKKANKEKKDREQAQMIAQLQRDKDEMIKLRAENEALKKPQTQYSNNWKNYKKTDETTISPALASTFV